MNALVDSTRAGVVKMSDQTALASAAVLGTPLERSRGKSKYFLGTALILLAFVLVGLRSNVLRAGVFRRTADTVVLVRARLRAGVLVPTARRTDRPGGGTPHGSSSPLRCLRRIHRGRARGHKPRCGARVSRACQSGLLVRWRGFRRCCRANNRVERFGVAGDLLDVRRYRAVLAPPLGHAQAADAARLDGDSRPRRRAYRPALDLGTRTAFGCGAKLGPYRVAVDSRAARLI